MVRKMPVYEPEVGAEALPLIDAPDDRPMSVVIHPLANVLKQRRRWLCFLWVLLLFHCTVAILLTVILAVQPPIFGIGHNHTMDIDFETYDFNISLSDVAFLCVFRPLLLIIVYRAIQSTANIPILLSSVVTIAFLSVKFRHFEVTRNNNHESIDAIEYMLFGVGFGFALLEIIYNWMFIQPMATRVKAARKLWGNTDVERIGSDDGCIDSIVVLPNQGGNVQAPSIALTHYEDISTEGIPSNSYYEDNVVVPPSLIQAPSSPLSERKLMEANGRYGSAVPMYATARPRAQSGYSSNSGHSMYHTPDGSPDSHHGVDVVGFGTPDTSDEVDVFKQTAQTLSHGDDKFGTPDSSLRGSPVTVMSEGDKCEKTFGTPSTSPFSDNGVSLNTSTLHQFSPAPPIAVIGKNATQMTWDMGMGDGTPWKQITEVDGVTVSSCEDSVSVINGVTGSPRLILKSQSVIDHSVDKIESLLTASFRKRRASQQPQNGKQSTNSSNLQPWSPIFDLLEVIENIDIDTDVVYTTMSSQAGGLITPRDFVTVRKREKRAQSIIIAESPVEIKTRPETKDTIRASLGPGGYILTAVESKPDTTRVMWILNVDLKAWLPPLLLKQTMSDLVLKHHKQISETCTTI
eukprot:m.263642 g.263642  ORF g.263642 m.263642 type:complete len:631 (+) comp51398_c0_seq1:219-2111(+)